MEVLISDSIHSRAFYIEYPLPGIYLQFSEVWCLPVCTETLNPILLEHMCVPSRPWILGHSPVGIKDPLL